MFVGIELNTSDVPQYFHKINSIKMKLTGVDENLKML